MGQFVFTGFLLTKVHSEEFKSANQIIYVLSHSYKFHYSKYKAEEILFLEIIEIICSK
jgi:hypothetical protein